MANGSWQRAARRPYPCAAGGGGEGGDVSRMRRRSAAAENSKAKRNAGILAVIGCGHHHAGAKSKRPL
jgi:hypothetical protein